MRSQRPAAMTRRARGLLCVTAVALSWAPAARAQDTTEGIWSIGTGFSSSRDELNVGLLYQGGGLHGRYLHRHSHDGREFSWSTGMAITAQWSRGMTALALDLTPLETGLLFDVVDRDWRLRLGPGFAAHLGWNVNPELQSGSFFWYTHYDLEVRAAGEFGLGGQRFRTDMHTTVATLSSRPDVHPDPYFYSWGFGDLVSAAHSNMSLGSLGMARRVMVSTEWYIPGSGSRMGLVYRLDYAAYRTRPKLSTLHHTVHLTWH